MTKTPGKKAHSLVSLLHSVATITSLRDRDLLATTLVNTLFELIQGKCIAMYMILFTRQGKEAVVVADAGNHENIAPAVREASYVISGKVNFKSSLNAGREHSQTLGDGKFLTIYPIISQRSTIGVLELVSETIDEMDRYLISSFMKVYSNYLSVLDESETDALTRLLNRRTFDNNLEKIIAEQAVLDDNSTNGNRKHDARRKEGAESPHWLAVMDIDHFKRINDKFGHLYGDEVLILLARHMQKIFRHRDKLFRFGGEEFVVVLDRTSLKSVRRVLERLRTAIEEYEFPQVGKVTISIGFVRLDKADVPSAIIGRADQTLYYAKQNGRNQVCFYEDLIAAGKLSRERFSDDVQIFD